MLCVIPLQQRTPAVEDSQTRMRGRVLPARVDTLGNGAENPLLSKTARVVPAVGDSQASEIGRYGSGRVAPLPMWVALCELG